MTTSAGMVGRLSRTIDCVHGRLVRDRNLLLFAAGRLVSSIGTAMAPLAIIFAMLEQGVGSGGIASVLTARLLPGLILILAGGAIADRLPRRRLMIAADVLRFVTQGSLAILLIDARPALWIFVTFAFLQGLGDTLYAPASSGLLPSIVDRARIQAANATLAMCLACAGAVAPGLAGVLIATFNPGSVIALDAVGYLVSALCIAGLTVRPSMVAEPEPFIVQIRTGWRELVRRRWLCVLVMQNCLTNMVCFGPFQVIGPMLFRDDPFAWGQMLSAAGLGAAVGAAVATRIRPGRPLVVVQLAGMSSALAGVLLAVHAGRPLILIGLMCSGLGTTIAWVMTETTVQRCIPHHALSRVVSYMTLGVLAFAPLGFVLAAPMVAVLGLEGGLWLGVGVVVASAAVALATPAVARFSWDD